MVDSVAAQASTIPSSITQPIPQTVIDAAIDASTRLDAVNNAAFLSQIVQGNLQDSLLTIGNDNVNQTLQTQTSDQSDINFNEGLLNLGVDSLEVLNNVNNIGTDPRSSNITSGNLTAEQIQAIGVLIADEEKLEAAASLTSPIPFTGAAATVDLSVRAQDILNASADAGLTADGQIAAATAAAATSAQPASGDTNLTAGQLTQLGAIIGPVAGQPLTVTLLTQLQTQVNASMQNPVQLSINTVFQVLNYIGGMQPVIAEEAREAASANTDERVAPTAPASATSDDIAIQHYNV